MQSMCERGAATSMGVKRGGGGLIIARQGISEEMSREGGRTKGGMNKKLHAVSDRPISFFVTAG